MTCSLFLGLRFAPPQAIISPALQASRITGFPAGYENSSTGAEGASR
jgi:hypothetical protein